MGKLDSTNSKAKKTPAQPTMGRSSKAVRSERSLEVPWYKAEGRKAPTAEELLAASGLEATRILTPQEARSILKVEDDFTTVTDNVVITYEQEHAALGLADLPPSLLAQMHERAVYVQDRAKELRRAADIADAQALVVKGDLLNAALRIRRRAHALAEEQPDVLKPWGFFDKYVARRFPGRGAVIEEDAPEELAAPVAEPLVVRRTKVAKR